MTAVITKGTFEIKRCKQLLISVLSCKFPSQLNAKLCPAGMQKKTPWKAKSRGQSDVSLGTGWDTGVQWAHEVAQGSVQASFIQLQGPRSMHHTSLGDESSCQHFARWQPMQKGEPPARTGQQSCWFPSWFPSHRAGLWPCHLQGLPQVLMCGHASANFMRCLHRYAPSDLTILKLCPSPSLRL